MPAPRRPRFQNLRPGAARPGRAAALLAALGAALAAGLLGGALRLEAQGLGSSRGAMPGSRPVPARAAREDGIPLPSRTVREAILTRGEPRSYQVLAVPVPEEFADGDSIGYEIMTSGVGTIIGRREGRVPPGPRGRRVLVTLGIPARALAGRATAATVVFRAPDGNEIETPVDVDVTGVHRLDLRGVRELRGARPGDVLEARYTVTNRGNVRDTIRLRLQAPPDWRARLATAVHVLAPGASAEGQVRLWVPRAGASGTFSATLTARASSVVAEHHLMLEVTPLTSANRAFGPLARGGVAAVSAGGRSAAVGTLAIAGPLTERVDVDARVTTANALDAAASRGLSRVGYFVAPPFLSLTGDRWRAAAGNTASTLTELTGLSVWGSGLSAGWRDSTHTANVFAARPVGAPDARGDGELLAAHYGRRLGATRASATLSHLREPAGLQRELTAASLGLARDLGRFGGISGEIAARDYGSGRGIGVTSELVREGERQRGQLRATYAPGGSEGFARVRDELSGAWSLRLAERWATSLSAFSAHDENRAFRAVTSRAFSVQQALQYTRNLALALELRTTSFAARSRTAGSGFGNDEHRASLSTNGRWNRTFFNAELAGGALARRVEAEGVALPGQSGGRLTWRGTAGTTTPQGSFEIEQTLERNGAGTGFMPQAFGVGLRATHMPLPLGRIPLYLQGELQHQRFGAVRAPFTIARAGATTQLPLGLDATIDLERNPLFVRPDGSAALILALKVERSLRLPRAELTSTEGHVYKDLDADGVRGPGEPGIGGVVVRIGDERATSDARGRYVVRGRVRGQPVLDLASLPIGWVPSEAPTTVDVGRRELAVLPTANVEVRLTLTADADGRLPTVDLQQALVFARDQRGRDWVARRPTPERAVFSGLPAGDYTLEFDFAALAEPLRLRDTPKFSVRERDVAPVTVALYGRPLRFFRPQKPAAPDSAARPVPVTPEPEVVVPDVGGALPTTAVLAWRVRGIEVPPLVTPRFGRLRRARLGRARSATPRPGFDYRIREHDTMKKIAGRAYRRESSWPRVHEANRDAIRSPDRVRAGQLIVIPKLDRPQLRPADTRRILQRLETDALRLALRPGPDR